VANDEKRLLCLRLGRGDRPAEEQNLLFNGTQDGGRSDRQGVAVNTKTRFIVPLLALFVGSVALAEEPTDYRFPRECTMTPAGYPVPLCGKPLTKTPVGHCQSNSV